nr:MAG TPA: hypothetical protein [Bacteriophage sp.]
MQARKRLKRNLFYSIFSAGKTCVCLEPAGSEL